MKKTDNKKVASEGRSKKKDVPSGSILNEDTGDPENWLCPWKASIDPNSGTTDGR
ncbi:MAG: hypothetical protein WCX17_02890 [Parcubacteria group bacterium]|jgi:hypothetical protein